MTHKNDSAFVIPAISYPDGSYEGPSTGLTKREYFAAMAMQGMIASGFNNNQIYIPHVSQTALGFADALIDELNKE